MAFWLLQTIAAGGDHLGEVGIGGGFSLLVVREVLRFLKDKKTTETSEEYKKNTNTSGDKPVEFWQIEFKKAVTEAVEDHLGPVMAQQTRILEEIASTQRKTAETLVRLVQMAESQERFAAARVAARAAGG